MLVDIVIPSYKRPLLTRQALDSVLGQSYTNFKVYVVEDGSDDFAPLVKNYEGDKRFTYLKLNRNRGPAYARNYGAFIATPVDGVTNSRIEMNPHKKQPVNLPGEFIAFLDSDDIWAKDKLQKQIDYFSENPQMQWCHTEEQWVRNGELVKQKKKHRKPGGFFIGRLMERCLISASAVLFRRKFFESSGGFLNHYRVAEDYELWLRLNIKEPIGLIDEPLTIKRAGDWPQLSSTIEMDRYRVLALWRFYKKHNNEQLFAPYKEKCAAELRKKTNILLKGAVKYNNEKRASQYQRWLRIFDI